jgi:Family of unknown function (DUF6171)
MLSRGRRPRSDHPVTTRTKLLPIIMKCSNCPCPDICLQWDAFCAQAAKVPQVPNEIKHICNRSAMGAKPAPATISQQAANAAGALGRAFTAVVHGQKVLVDEKTLAARRATCETCDHLKGPKCELCGCFYQVKITLNTEKCPINKW